MGFLSEQQMNDMGIVYGDNVSISDKCSIYGELVVGNNVRIDDFCTITGSVSLGNNIHIGAYNALYGKMGIIMENYTGLSPRCTIFSASDDFSGNYLISPMNPKEVTNVTGGVVILRKFVQIGASTIIMPSVVIEEGSAIGAMSFVKHDISSYQIWAGNPLRYISLRSRNMINLIK
jgi:galactoside O-acetyltransferase